MGTFIVGTDPGPRRTDLVSSQQVIVYLEDGGLVVALPYTDLDTLTETIHLLAEAREKLISGLIDARGRTRPVLSVEVGDLVVVDATIVEVLTVVVHGDTVGIGYSDDGDLNDDHHGYREFPKGGMIVGLSPVADLTVVR